MGYFKLMDKMDAWFLEANIPGKIAFGAIIIAALWWIWKKAISRLQKEFFVWPVLIILSASTLFFIIVGIITVIGWLI